MQVRAYAARVVTVYRRASSVNISSFPLAACDRDQLRFDDALSFDDVRSIGGRESNRVHIAVAKYVFRSMYLFSNYGNGAYELYLHRHPEVRYRATMRSTEAPLRTPHLFKKIKVTVLEDELALLLSSFKCGGLQTCSCATPRDVTLVQSLPFLEIAPDCADILMPQQFINGTRMLNLRVGEVKKRK
jgi:hypothetical protein